MINNRQAGRRNRGRNNGRPNGGNRGGDNGNRIDNRARGNAPQLLEKYRNMARDAQLAGDRVSTEYYLQFADHYFRVIADNRARQEEHQARFRRPDESFEEYGDQIDTSFEEEPAEAPFNDAGAERPQGRRGRPNREVRTELRSEEPAPAPVVENDIAEEDNSPKRTPRGRKPRKPREETRSDEGEGFGLDLAALPPAISRADNDSGDEEPSEEAPAPRRRGRRPRAAAEAAE